METKTIHKTATVLKTLPMGFKAPEDGLWAVASAEMTDSSGDIIRADGISWKDYHQPPVRHLKILANHLRVLADGSSPIVGRVEEFRRANMTLDNQQVKALTFRFSWAKDGEGKITDLAKKFKDLFDGGYLDSFSVGIMCNEVETMDTGDDITECELFEISAVTIPALPTANAMKEIKEKLAGLIDEVAEVEVDLQEETTIAICERMANTVFEKLSHYSPQANTKNIEEFVTKILETLKQVQQSLKVIESVHKAQQDMLERFDTLESAIVVHSTTPAQVSDNQKAGSNKGLQALNSKLDCMLKYLDT